MDNKLLLISQLNQAQKFFLKNTHDFRFPLEWYMHSHLQQLYAESLDPSTKLKNRSCLNNLINMINNIFSAVCNIDKLNLSSDWNDNKNTEIQLVYIHYQLRSLMDEIALFVKHNFGNKTPDSYTKLLAGTKSDKYHKILPDNLRKILLKYDEWYEFIRDIRDHYAHHASRVFIFPSQPNNTSDTLFSIQNQKMKSLLIHPFVQKFAPNIKFNENEVYELQSYITLILTFLFTFIDELAEIFITSPNLPEVILSNQSFGIYVTWNKKLLEKLHK